MFAADCPTKRAAFMTDMTLGCWSHVPAISISPVWLHGKGLSPRTPRTDFVWSHRFCMVAAICELGRYLFIYLFIYLFTYLFIYLFIYLFYLLIYLLIYLWPLFGTSFEHFSPTYGWLMETSGQGFGIANFVMPHSYSRDYFMVDSFNSLSFLFCMLGIQFPTDPIKDPFLV